MYEKNVKILYLFYDQRYPAKGNPPLLIKVEEEFPHASRQFVNSFKLRIKYLIPVFFHLIEQELIMQIMFAIIEKGKSEGIVFAKLI